MGQASSPTLVTIAVSVTHLRDRRAHSRAEALGLFLKPRCPSAGVRARLARDHQLRHDDAPATPMRRGSDRGLIGGSGSGHLPVLLMSLQYLPDVPSAPPSTLIRPAGAVNDSPVTEEELLAFDRAPHARHYFFEGEKEPALLNTTL